MIDIDVVCIRIYRKPIEQMQHSVISNAENSIDTLLTRIRFLLSKSHKLNDKTNAVGAFACEKRQFFLLYFMHIRIVRGIMIA